MTPLRARTTRLSKQPPATVTPARWAAYRTVHRTFADDAWTDRAFAGEADRAALDSRDRAFAQRLAYGAVQRAGAMDHVIATVGKRPVARIDALVLSALRLGMYELLETSGADHSAVDQAVEMVRAACGERPVPFANAVLRRGQADGPGILARQAGDDPAQLAVRLSMPVWMVQRVRDAFGEEGVAALAAQNEPRGANALRRTALRADETTSVEMAMAPPPFDAIPEARVLDAPLRTVASDIDAGVLVPQSLASMLVCAVLDPQPGERVLDMCAAPGNKTTAIAGRMENRGELVACDLHETRVDSIRALATRLGCGIVDARCVDATTLSPEQVGRFDRVLLDAPCTGSGVLGRRPDARWRRHEDDLPALLALQRDLLRAGSQLVEPGGVLVYSTCSLLREENEALVADATALDLVPDPVPTPFAPLAGDAPHQLRTWPHRHPTDGFFVARFRRSAS